MNEALPLPTVRSVETAPSRVLLRLPNWVGDVVMAGPAVAAIAAALPEAELVAQVKPPLKALAALLPGVSRVLDAGTDRGPRSLLASRKRLRAQAFEAAVVFPRGTRALLAPFLAGIPMRVGFGGRGHGWALTHPVEGWRAWRGTHRSRYFGLLALPFGVELPAADSPEAIVPPLSLPASARGAAEALLRGLGRRKERPLALLEPGSAYGPAKCWPAERYGDLAARLLEEGFDVVTVGTAEGRPVEARVAARAPGLLRTAGRTPDLAALAGLCAAADVAIANDTGPMHVAAAVGTPLLALFGATDPVVSAPLGPGVRRVLYEPEPCSPCFLRACPVEGHPCLARFGVERVLGAAMDLYATVRAEG